MATNNIPTPTLKDLKKELEQLEIDMAKYQGLQLPAMVESFLELPLSARTSTMSVQKSSSVKGMDYYKTLILRHGELKARIREAQQQKERAIRYRTALNKNRI